MCRICFEVSSPEALISPCECTGSQKCNKRINKNILLWALDIVEYGGRIGLFLIAGKDNVLADSASRNPEDRDEARERSLSVVGGPVKRIMKMMITPLLLMMIMEQPTMLEVTTTDIPSPEMNPLL